MRCFSFVFSSEFPSEISCRTNVFSMIKINNRITKSLYFYSSRLVVRPIGIFFVATDFDTAFECQLLEYNKVVKWMLQIEVLFSIEPSVLPFELLAMFG